ncbi:MAG: hypothetical protein LBJ67_16610 [Planctomycetaceae bacterium]|jgi:hypothetical protein|nr:hypothetical protein [Planctomycetaceae bacterium]
MLNGIDPASYLSVIRELSPLKKSDNTPIQAAALESAKKSKASPASADTLLLSPSAKQLFDFFAAQPQDATDNENADIDLEGMKLRGDMLAETLQLQLNAFQGKMLGILGGAGMNTDSPINLQTGANGNVQVTNERPDKEKIESLFQNMPGLSKDFRQISMLASVVRMNNMSEKSSELNNFTSLNPLSALTQYAKNSDAMTSDKFNLRLAENNVSYYFGS